MLLLLAGAPAVAQVKPDSTRRDTALLRQLEELLRDSTKIARPDLPRQIPQTPGQVGGQSLNPDISAIGELLTDFSPGRARTTGEGRRFEVREVELGIQAVVDPFFRADFFIGLHPEAVEVEEAYLTALNVGGFQFKLGRFLLPIGKVNLIHRAEQITVDYPWAVQRFFGAEGLASNGISVSHIVAPFGFYQEVIGYVVSGLAPHAEEGGDGHAHGGAEEEADAGPVIAADDDLRNQIALGAQLRNYWDLTPALNAELGFSLAAGRNEAFESLNCGPAGTSPCAIGESPTRRQRFEPQKYYGTHLTIRWRPLQQGLYRSLIWNNELLVNDGPEGKRLGAFSQAQWQLTRRTYIGARYDAVEAAEDSGWMQALSGYFTVFPSEFSRFKLALERTFGSGDPFGGQWRGVLQTTFAIGPHRPHAF